MTDKPDSPTGPPGYRALRCAVALLEEPRVIFLVEGSRAGRIVSGLVTNSLDGIADGQGCYAFALTAKGRPIADMRVLPVPGFERAGEAERLWLDVPEAAAEGFRDLLARTVPPIFATVTEPGFGRLSLAGGRARELAVAVLERAGLSDAGGGDDGADAGFDPLTARTREIAGEAGLLVGREEIEATGVDVYAPLRALEGLRESLSDAVVASGGAIASAEDWETVRVERGLPRYGADITTDNLPQETGQTGRAISFDKGCYTGQEVVARLHYRGHVNRVLRGLRPVAGDAAMPATDLRGFAPGAVLEVDGRPAGVITSAVRSPRLGPIGLGYVRTTVEPEETVAAAGSGDVEVLALPFTST